MDLTAKLIQVLPAVTGEGKNGPWKKQDIVVETAGQYPKKVCFTIWGDKFNEAVLKPNNDIKVFFDPESREYNGKWYTELRAWKVEAVMASANANFDDGNAMPPSFNNADDSFEDLPF
jgi:hypothetical protein